MAPRYDKQRPNGRKLYGKKPTKGGPPLPKSPKGGGTEAARLDCFRALSGKGRKK
jgi:hypothetical protein